MRLLVFNPESDLALAANDAHYTPPASARRMAADLQRLPCLWASGDDAILLSNGTLCDADGNPRPCSDVRHVTSVAPWGWNPLVAQRLGRMGVAPSLLPSPMWLTAYRATAGRATAAQMLTRLHAHPKLAPWRQLLVGETVVCRTLADARAAHARYGATLFKQPWSGSGRGLHPATATPIGAKTEAWLRRTLHTQGYVMAEPIYNKVQDMAAEFTCHADGRVTFDGLSIFITTPGGVYDGNIVASEDCKRDIVARHIPLALLDATVEVLADLIGEHVGSHLGAALMPLPVGVDMMLTEGGRLHPCVEVNWRMTMGMVALHIAHRVAWEAPGSFNIVCRDGHYAALLSQHSPQFAASEQKL